MGPIASQITSLTSVYSIVYSEADQRKHQSSASPAFVRGIHRWPVNSPHKWPVTRKMFPFDDVIMSIRKSFACATASEVQIAGCESVHTVGKFRYVQNTSGWRGFWILGIRFYGVRLY